MARFRFVGSVRWPVALVCCPVVVRSGVWRSSVRRWVLVFAPEGIEQGGHRGREAQPRRGDGLPGCELWGDFRNEGGAGSGETEADLKRARQVVGGWSGNASA